MQGFTLESCRSMIALLDVSFLLPFSPPCYLSVGPKAGVQGSVRQRAQMYARGKASRELN